MDDAALVGNPPNSNIQYNAWVITSHTSLHLPHCLIQSGQKCSTPFLRSVKILILLHRCTKRQGNQPFLRFFPPKNISACAAAPSIFTHAMPTAYYFLFLTPEYQNEIMLQTFVVLLPLSFLFLFDTFFVVSHLNHYTNSLYSSASIMNAKKLYFRIHSASRTM